MSAPGFGSYEAANAPQPPHNIELEQALLGAILLNNEAWHACAHLVEERDFYDPLHSRIFHAIRNKLEQNAAATALTLRREFENEPPIIEGLTVPQYLVRLITAATTVVNAPWYAKDIRELSRRRDVLSDGAAFLRALGNDNADLSDTCGDFIAGLDDVLCDRDRGKGPVNAKTIAQQVYQDIGESKACVPTGLADLDRVLGGYYRGEYVVLAGRPSMGKSAVACSSLLRLGLKGYGVLYCSAEMTAEALMQRCFADLTWNAQTPLSYVDIRRGRISEHDKERIAKALERFENSNFIIDDRPAPTVAEIGARARAEAGRLQREGKRLDVICVDHMGKMASSGRYAGNKVQEVGEISAGLAALAKDLDCTVIALSQLSRAVEQKDRKSRRPELSDLRNSGDIEQDADVVMFVYRKAYYLERDKWEDREAEEQRLNELEGCQNQMELIVAKQRSGYTASVDLLCAMASNAIRSRHNG